jgi:hypothetical protein
VKELLEQVMPEFEPVPDRVEKVRRRMRARRDRRLVVGAAAAVLAVAAGAGVLVARPAVEMASTAASGDVCLPGSHTVYTPLRTPVRLKLREPLPERASKVTLCVYENIRDVFEPGAEVKLVGFKVQADDGSIQRKVNAAQRGLPPESCATSGVYRLVFEYPGQDPVQLQLSNRCGVPVAPEDLLHGDIRDALDRLDGPFATSVS